MKKETTAIQVTHADLIEKIHHDLAIAGEYEAEVAAVEQAFAQLKNPITNNGECVYANDVNVHAHKLIKEFDAERKKAKLPFKKILEYVDELVKPLTDRLESVKAQSDALLLAYKREVERKAREQEIRQQEERMKYEEEERKRLREIEIARRKNETPPPAPPVQTAMPVIAKVEIPKMAVRTMKIKKVHIKDASMIPIGVRMPDGSELEIRPINEAAVKKALLAGVFVSGAELVEEEVPTR